MRGTTRRFGSGAHTPQAAVRLESRRGHHLAFPGASRTRIGSMWRLPGLQGTYRHHGCQLGFAKSLFQKESGHLWCLGELHQYCVTPSCGECGPDASEECASPDCRPLPMLWKAIQSFHSHRELGACVRSIYANRNSKGDFLLNELERWADRGLSVCIASAFFTDAEVVERLLYKGFKPVVPVLSISSLTGMLFQGFKGCAGSREMQAVCRPASGDLKIEFGS